jgi:hypothetical protein
LLCFLPELQPQPQPKTAWFRMAAIGRGERGRARQRAGGQVAGVAQRAGGQAVGVAQRMPVRRQPHCRVRRGGILGLRGAASSVPPGRRGGRGRLVERAGLVGAAQLRRRPPSLPQLAGDAVRRAHQRGKRHVAEAHPVALVPHAVRTRHGGRASDAEAGRSRRAGSLHLREGFVRRAAGTWSVVTPAIARACRAHPMPAEARVQAAAHALAGPSAVCLQSRARARGPRSEGAAPRVRGGS